MLPDPEPADLYDAAYFRELDQFAVRSARAAVPIVRRMLRCARVLDIGSGQGAWAQAFAESGCEVLAVDGDYVDLGQLHVPPGDFIAHDLRTRLPDGVLNWNGDLVLCLEVAEHLPHSRGPSLIDELAVCSDRLLFSAATERQRGRGHINERPHEYWVRLLEERGFAVSRVFQRVLAAVPDVAWWYQENILLAVRAVDRPPHIASA